MNKNIARTFIAIGIIIFITGLVMLTTKKDTTQITWAETQVWTATEHSDGKIHIIELGFGNDGTVKWRMGRVKTE